MATKHYDVLDGLRGTAALAVVVFHLFEYVFPDPVENPLRHAYLAVDFFFLLSGFVIGHAYDRRWPSMSVGGFFKVRLTRLHPLVLLGLMLGFAAYALDPFAGETQNVSLGLLVLNVLLGILVLPAPALPNRYNATHSLDSPSWSLMQEYAANIVYALVAPHLGRKALAFLVVLAGAALAGMAVYNGNLSAGWGWDSFWIAPFRVAFPFFAGLFLYKMGGMIRFPLGYPILSALLLAVFMTPIWSFNGAFEAAIIIILFPLIVAAGAGSEVNGRMGALCKFCGRISYPLYITHYPFVEVYAHWLVSTKPAPTAVTAVSVAMVVFLVAFAWAADRYFDVPLRAWLARRSERSVPSPALAGTQSVEI